MRFVKLGLKILGGIFGFFVLASVVAYFLIDLDKIINEQLTKFLPEVEKMTGRKVTVGNVSTGFLPTLGATISEVQIADSPASALAQGMPTLKIGEVKISISLLDAITSMGKEVTLNNVDINGVEGNVTRFADGTMSFQDILDNLAKGEKPATPAEEAEPEDKPATAPEVAKPLDPKVKEIIEGTVVNSIGLWNAAFRFEDRMTPSGKPAVVFVKKFNFGLKDVNIKKAITVSLDMAAFADETNFWFSVKVGPIPSDLQIKDPMKLVHSIKLKSSGIELGHIGPYLPETLPVKIDKMKFLCDYEIKDVDLSAPINLKGFVALNEAVFKGGKQFDLKVDKDLTVNMAADTLEIAKIDISIGEVNIGIKGKLNGFQKAPDGLTFSGFSIESKTLNPGKLMSYYPVPGVPVQINGNIILDVKADGDVKAQKASVLVDLTGTHIVMPGTLDKNAGAPLSLKLGADVNPDKVDVSQFNFKFGPIDMNAKAQVTNYKSPSPNINLDLSSNQWAFGEIARLVPAVKASIPPGTNIGGTGGIALKFKGTPTDLDIDFKLFLKSLGLSMPGTNLNGNIDVTAVVKGNPQKNLAVNAGVEMGKATIIVKDALNKPAGTPMDLNVVIDKSGDLVTIKTFEFLMGVLQIKAGGSMNQASGKVDVNVQMPPLDLDKFAQTVTALQASPVKGGKLSLKIMLEGNPNKMETMGVALKDFNFVVGKNSIIGNITVKNPKAPQLMVDINMPRMHLDEVIPPSPEEAAEQKQKEQQKKAAKPGPSPPPKKPVCPPPNKQIHDIKLDGRIRMGDALIANFPMKNFDFHLTLEKGLAHIKKFQFFSYGGSFSGTNTFVNIYDCVGDYNVDVGLNNVDINAMLSDQTTMKNSLYGRLFATIKVKGKGLDMYYMSKNNPPGKAMSGKIGGSIKNGKYAAGNIANAVMGPIAGAVPGGKASKDDGSFKNLDAYFTVKDGRLILEKPIVMVTGGAKTELDGSIGMDKTLNLKGTYFMSGGAATAITGGKCKVTSDVPVPLLMKGTVDKPEFAGIDAKKPANVIAKACFGKEVEAAKKEVEKKAKEQLKKQGGKAKEAGKKMLKKLF